MYTSLDKCVLLYITHVSLPGKHSPFIISLVQCILRKVQPHELANIHCVFYMMHENRIVCREPNGILTTQRDADSEFGDPFHFKTFVKHGKLGDNK